LAARDDVIFDRGSILVGIQDRDQDGRRAVDGEGGQVRIAADLSGGLLDLAERSRTMADPGQCRVVA
jgi:hypothetical protein